MELEYAHIQELIESTIETEVEKCVKSVKQENINLQAEVAQLTKEITELTEKLNKSRSNNTMSALMLNIVDQLNSRIQETEDKDEKEKFVYNLLNLLFKPDFEEPTYDVPTWLGAIVNYYNNREFVIQVLNLLHIKMPDNISKFRLPMDWAEEELDCFFETMRNHIVCNGCTFKDNLRFWKPFALKSVKDNCNTNYSEIPWQFVLRNPILLKKKYLKKIGQMAFSEPYIAGWRYFFRIDEYQNLTDTQLKIIIDNIDSVAADTSKNDVCSFLLRHIELIEDCVLLDKLYDKYYDSYDFMTRQRILKMPYSYIKRWAKDCERAYEFIIRNKDKFTKEQRKELLDIILQEDN